MLSVYCLIFTFLISGMTETVIAADQEEKTITKDGLLEFSQNYDSTVKDEQTKSVPNVTEALKHIKNFDGDNLVLANDESAPGYNSINMYHYELKMSYLKE